MKPKVLIVGGNYAGLECALSLSSRRYDVTVVDRTEQFEWLPNIHELISGYKRPQRLQLQRRTLLNKQGHRFVCSEVTRLDPNQHRVHLKSGDVLRYDYLVVALGGVNNTFGIPGAESYAVPFKSVGDCYEIRRRLDELDKWEQDFSVVIVGGGIEGVEALGELVRRFHQAPNFNVHLVDAGPQLLPSTDAVVDATIKRTCRNYPIEFSHDCKVVEVTENAVRLNNGRVLPSHITVWTGGVKPNPLLAECGLDLSNGWVQTNEALQSTSDERVFVIGDAAATPFEIGKQAYHAADMGKHAAINLQRLHKDKSLKPFHPAPKPVLVSFGDRETFMIADHWCVASPLMGVAKEAVYAIGMSQLRWQGGLRERLRQAGILWESGRQVLENHFMPKAIFKTATRTRLHVF